MEVDAIDLKILSHLQRQGRITWAQLSAQLGLSAPATADRVRRLEDAGLITGYHAHLDPAALGHHLTAFVAVTLERPEHRQPFLDCVGAQPTIQECHHVTGDDDYLMKVRCRTTRELEHLISNVLKQLPGIVRTRTLIALSTVKETAEIGVEAGSQESGGRS